MLFIFFPHYPLFSRGNNSNILGMYLTPSGLLTGEIYGSFRNQLVDLDLPMISVPDVGVIACLRIPQLLLVPKNFLFDKRPYSLFLSRVDTSNVGINSNKKKQT
jgi:hypothetical protein